MADKTEIEWTDATWNPVTGCTKVSPGCDHCYAETLAERFRGTPGHYYENGFDVQLRPDKLDLPLRWKKPRRIFVNSMSDLFHKDVPDAYIGTVFDVMARAEHHTFQVLTKRHGRMRSLLRRWAETGIVTDGGYLREPYRPLGSITHNAPLWTPPPNVWLGVSVEDQQRADLRIPALLDTPAAIRFLSCEPLLGSVSLFANTRIDTGTLVDWVIVGGESGRGARPMNPAWARALRTECTTFGIPFLFKQWGEWVDDDHARELIGDDGLAGMRDLSRSAAPTGFPIMRRVGKRNAGRELDGRTWDQFPECAS